MHEVFKALSSEHRIEILRLIAELTASKRDASCCAPNEICVCKISERLDLAPSTISHHLNSLREAGVLKARREGTWIYYSIDEGRLREAAEFLLSIGRRAIGRDPIEKRSVR